jgi:hypothetical protein
VVNAWLLRAPRIALCAGARQVASDMLGFRAMASEVLMFLASGCAGTVIGSAIPTAWTSALGQLVAGSSTIACFTVSGAIVLMSATAIHPMLSAVIVHLTAVLVGWGLAIIVTPFSVLSLMASRWSGIPVLVISLRANAWFVLLALATSSTLLGIMARLITH